MDILEIDTTLSYCPTTLAVCKPLKLTNVSTDELAFKVTFDELRSKPTKKTWCQ
jgi:hypothetical protein